MNKRKEHSNMIEMKEYDGFNPKKHVLKQESEKSIAARTKKKSGGNAKKQQTKSTKKTKG